MADKLAIIRSIVGANGEHDAFQCLTGAPKQQQPAGGWPSLGAVRFEAARGPSIRRCRRSSVCRRKMGHMPWADPGQPGFLGIAHAAFKPDGRRQERHGAQRRIARPARAIAGRCWRAFDRFRRDADTSGMMHGHGRVQPAGVRRAHVEQAGRCPGFVEGRPKARRALRHRATPRTATTAGRN